MIDEQQPEAAPPRVERRVGSVNVVSAVFAGAVALGGTYLEAGVASGWRAVVIGLLLVAFLAFAAAALGTLPAAWPAPWVSLGGAVAVGAALAVAWSVTIPADGLSGLVQIDDGKERICGVITARDHDFIAVTQKVPQNNGPGTRVVDAQGRPIDDYTDVPWLVRLSSVVTVASVDHC